ncbi:hypothetical protein DGMP_01390 [Desulfomarina profundi]|uniref:4'-phosphopantetheinyl transferase domain-containing protein n=1 Tax=Desulfomarina profundi TaxID=2772557 RepID=A0A8D5FEY8_9BACT|nr:4'-phosphopantetheinyl transferase superfamily protein [Desulfomarina profundi]BCL59446.1 hypothetical protein DGMP_01390 [Desulfomarina profundi]
MSADIVQHEIRDFIDEIPASVSCPPVILKLQEDTPRNRKALHENELARLDSYRLTKRRREYLTGRICAKEAVLIYLHACNLPPVSADKIEIVNRENGHPAALLHPLPHLAAPHISISHSKEMATAIASPCPCGIDLQKIEKKLLKVKKRFCSESELGRLAEIAKENELNTLALLWCAKEAIQKRFGHNTMLGFSEIHLQQCVQIKIKPHRFFQLKFFLSKKQAPLLP